MIYIQNVIKKVKSLLHLYDNNLSDYDVWTMNAERIIIVSEIYIKINMGLFKTIYI